MVLVSGQNEGRGTKTSIKWGRRGCQKIAVRTCSNLEIIDSGGCYDISRKLIPVFNHPTEKADPLLFGSALSGTYRKCSTLLIAQRYVGRRVHLTVCVWSLNKLNKLTTLFGGSCLWLPAWQHRDNIEH